MKLNALMVLMLNSSSMWKLVPRHVFGLWGRDTNNIRWRLAGFIHVFTSNFLTIAGAIKSSWHTLAGITEHQLHG